MNDLITIPYYNNEEVKYIEKCSLIVNGVVREENTKGIYVRWGYSKKDKYKMLKFYTKLWLEYLHENYYIKEKSNGSCTKVLQNDVLLPLKEIRKKNKDLNLDRFITKHTINIIPEIIPDNVDSLSIELEYIKIRSPIVSYLQQKLNLSKDELLALKEVFNTKKNDLTFDEYLDKKSKHLLSLNLDNEFGDTEHIRKEGRRC